MLFQSGSSPALTNPAFTLGLFHPYHTPNEHFWNKLVSSIVHVEEINAFLINSFIKENIDLSHTLDQSLPNRTIRDDCMCDSAKIANAKDRLKQGTFKSMIDKKFCTRKHQWTKMLHDKMLK